MILHLVPLFVGIPLFGVLSCITENPSKFRTLGVMSGLLQVILVLLEHFWFAQYLTYYTFQIFFWFITFLLLIQLLSIIGCYEAYSEKAG